MTIDTDPRLSIGGNKPPLAITIRENHADVFTKLDELAAADALAELVPGSQRARDGEVLALARLLA